MRGQARMPSRSSPTAASGTGGVHCLAPLDPGPWLAGLVLLVACMTGSKACPEEPGLLDELLEFQGVILAEVELSGVAALFPASGSTAIQWWMIGTLIWPP